MIKLFLFRHPVPEQFELRSRISLLETTQSSDLGLVEGAADHICSVIEGLDVELLLCSPLKRCSVAAKVIGQRLGIIPRILPCLKELVSLKVELFNNEFFRDVFVFRNHFLSFSFILQFVPWISKLLPFAFSGESYAEVLVRNHVFSRKVISLCNEIPCSRVSVITHQAFISLLKLYSYFAPGWKVISSDSDFSGCTVIHVTRTLRERL